METTGHLGTRETPVLELFAPQSLSDHRLGQACQGRKAKRPGPVFPDSLLMSNSEYWGIAKAMIRQRM
jgi:hypothetical protein